LATILYDRNLDVAGKHYLGTADHLFQYGSDPADNEHYGYFYYDSMLNAASYHQGNSRFYVYDYLERTADSKANNSYSDFLPLNSPYANTNGKATGTYTYNGVHNEYVGVPHLSYDSKYSDSDNSPNRIITNYWFGMHMEMEFYLPSVPGTVDSDGMLANQSIVGDDMVFEFSGDDDVWVLIDGKLVLDIGGIHGVESGSIDFSTGDVIVDGVKTGTVTNLSAGSHTLTMYYLERGSSMSNFKLRFNFLECGVVKKHNRLPTIHVLITLDCV
jgi:fibro-slime domain-containing protein